MRMATDCVLNEGKKRKSEIMKNPGIPILKHKTGKSWPTDLCGKYNSRGSCSFDDRCKYRHMCSQYLVNHAAKQCNAEIQ